MNAKLIVVSQIELKEMQKQRWSKTGLYEGEVKLVNQFATQSFN